NWPGAARCEAQGERGGLGYATLRADLLAFDDDLHGAAVVGRGGAGDNRAVELVDAGAGAGTIRAAKTRAAVVAPGAGGARQARAYRVIAEPGHLLRIGVDERLA